MKRFKLTIEYDGTPFHGWQRQQGLPTVQETLEKALETFAGHPCTLHVAGRTDTGVHALGQVAHVDIEKEMEPFKVLQATNHFLQDKGVCIVECEEVSADFHARFSATARRYLYKIIMRRPQLVLDRHRAWHVYKPLNIEKMQEATGHLIGTHDFTSFRSSECQSNSPVKTLDEITFDPQNESLVHVWFQSKSFLHHQVRNMIGTLGLVGEGKWPPEKIKEVLEAKDRTKAGPMAPADGLYLSKVFYE